MKERIKVGKMRWKKKERKGVEKKSSNAGIEPATS